MCFFILYIFEGLFSESLLSFPHCFAQLSYNNLILTIHFLEIIQIKDLSFSLYSVIICGWKSTLIFKYWSINLWKCMRCTFSVSKCSVQNVSTSEPNDLNFKGILSLLNYPLLLFIYTFSHFLSVHIGFHGQFLALFINSYFIQLNFILVSFPWPKKPEYFQWVCQRFLKKLIFLSPTSPDYILLCKFHISMTWIWKYMMKLIRKALSKEE